MIVPPRIILGYEANIFRCDLLNRLKSLDIRLVAFAEGDIEVNLRQLFVRTKN